MRLFLYHSTGSGGVKTFLALTPATKGEMGAQRLADRGIFHLLQRPSLALLQRVTKIQPGGD